MLNQIREQILVISSLSITCYICLNYTELDPARRDTELQDDQSMTSMTSTIVNITSSTATADVWTPQLYVITRDGPADRKTQFHGLVIAKTATKYAGAIFAQYTKKQTTRGATDRFLLLCADPYGYRPWS